VDVAPAVALATMLMRDEPAPTEPSRPAEPPASDEERDVERQLADLQKELTTARQAKSRHDERRLRRALDGLGVVTLGLRESGVGFELFGAATIRAGAPLAAIAGALDSMRDIEADDPLARAGAERLRTLERRRDELEVRLWELRAKRQP
jgi:hypothetical protein